AVVRKFFVNGPIFTIAGTGVQGYSGDGGSATKAQLNSPNGLAVDTKGNVYIADTGNNAVRALQAAGFGSAITSVVSAAGNSTGAVAPGDLVVLYGSNLGPSGNVVVNSPNAGGVYGTSLSGTTVYFNGVPGPILYTSATQVSAAVPYGVSGSNVQVYVVYQGRASAPVNVSVAAVAPALFTSDGSGKGLAAAINNADNSING